MAGAAIDDWRKACSRGAGGGAAPATCGGALASDEWTADEDVERAAVAGGAVAAATGSGAGAGASTSGASLGGSVAAAAALAVATEAASLM